MGYEQVKFDKGYSMVVGVDEVGRGALAGPVVTCAVGVDSNSNLVAGVNDSKKLSRRQREALASDLRTSVAYMALGVVEAAYVDTYGIVASIDECMRQSLKGIDGNVFVVVDGLRVPPCLGKDTVTAEAMVRADAAVYAVGAASILAKVWRDKYMRKQDGWFNEYGFKTNVGYGTAQHRRAIARNGFCPLHRRSFYHDSLPT